MSNETLAHVASLLTYSSSHRKDDEIGNEATGSNDNGCAMPVKQNSIETSKLETISYPSLSLSHPSVEKSPPSSAVVSSPTREEIQMKATTCMAQSIEVPFPSNNKKDSLKQCLLEEVSHHMLENILDSFDQLVDARIRQYSKVLSNHGLSLLSTSSTTRAADIVEYKLRTLLEIGTNISFDSISIKFIERTTGKEECDTSSGHSIPVMLVVEINSLQFHHRHGLTTEASSHGDNSQTNSSIDDHRNSNKVTFHASARIQGISSIDNSCRGNDDDDNNDDESLNNDDDIIKDPSTSLTFNKIIVQVDCEQLLQTMMDEAGKVVGMVVELTNQAWAERKQHEATDQHPSISSSKQGNAMAASCAEKLAASLPELKKNDECGSGLTVVKTVSEPELSRHPSLKAEDATVDTHRDFAYKDIRSWHERFHGGSSKVASSSSRDSDEENTNPRISAEKASHIIDYVFDEIDDVFIPSFPTSPSPPRPLKKPRLESS